MNLITPTELARIITEKTGEPFTRQATHKAMLQGLFPFQVKGKKKLIDLDDPAVQDYITYENRQRDQIKKNESQLDELKSMIVPEERAAIDRLVKLSPKTIPILLDAAHKAASELPTKKPVKSKKPSKLPAGNPGKPAGPSELYDDLHPYEIRRRRDTAIMRKKEIEAAAAEKKFLPIDFVQDYLFKYIEKLNSTIERIASVSASEIGEAAIAAGEVLPVHIERFTAQYLEAIHNTKLSITKEIKKYVPKP